MKHLLKLSLVLLPIAWARPAMAEEPKDSSAELPAAEAGEKLTEKQLAIQWAYDFMVSKVPPGMKIYYADGQETPEETEVRYRSIAKDVIEVAFDPETKVPFQGPSGRTKTAAVILGVMYHESSFMKHVDYALGPHGRGDGGRSWCMMQLNIGTGKTRSWNTKKDRVVYWGDKQEDIVEGYSGEDLIADRKNCIREGLKLIRMSYECPDNPDPLLQLNAYVSGKCTDGHAKSRVRMGTAIRWFNETRKQRKFTDKGVILAIEQERLVEKAGPLEVAEEPKSRPATES
jgi:hypothetical protein